MKKNSKLIALVISAIMSISFFNLTVFAEDKEVSVEATKEEAKEIVVPSDVSKDDWFYDYVLYNLKHNFMTGVEDDKFDPNGKTSRAQVYQLLYNIENTSPDGIEESINETSFTDVKGKWYEESAKWAESLNLTSGTGDGLYSGDVEVTREEVAAIFWNYAQKNNLVAEKADLTKFVDAEEISDWAKDSVAYGIDLGIISGREGNIFDPKGETTRAELATVVTKFFADEQEEVVEDEKPEVEVEEENVVSTKVIEISKYGNITVSITSKELKAKEFDLGDILTVSVNNEKVTAPFGSSYSDVNNGSVVIRGAKVEEKENDSLIIAVNMGDFAKKYNVKVGDEVKLSLSEKEGYLDEYEIRQLERSNDRADYSSDEVFANFRGVEVGDIAKGAYYRSSSPINNEIGRASYVDKFTKEASIVTVINLADSKEEYEGYIVADDFNSPYYKELYDEGQVILLDMGVDFTAQDFKDKLKVGLEFMAGKEGPFLIHCNEGKDRAGFVAALLQALMGATVEEIKEDYLVTYINYYHVEKGSEQYNKIAESNILESLRSIAGLKSGGELKDVDLKAAAEKYILSIGVSQENIDIIKKSLSSNSYTTSLEISNAA